MSTDCFMKTFFNFFKKYLLHGQKKGAILIAESITEI